MSESQIKAAGHHNPNDIQLEHAKLQVLNNDGILYMLCSLAYRIKSASTDKNDKQNTILTKIASAVKILTNFLPDEKLYNSYISIAVTVTVRTNDQLQ